VLVVAHRVEVPHVDVDRVRQRIVDAEQLDVGLGRDRDELGHLAGDAGRLGVVLLDLAGDAQPVADVDVEDLVVGMVDQHAAVVAAVLVDQVEARVRAGVEVLGRGQRDALDRHQLAALARAVGTEGAWKLHLADGHLDLRRGGARRGQQADQDGFLDHLSPP